MSQSTAHKWTKPEIDRLIADLIGIRNDLANNGRITDAHKVSQAVVLLDILAERRKT